MTKQNSIDNICIYTYFIHCMKSRRITTLILNENINEMRQLDLYIMQILLHLFENKLLYLNVSSCAGLNAIILKYVHYIIYTLSPFYSFSIFYFTTFTSSYDFSIWCTLVLYKCKWTNLLNQPQRYVSLYFLLFRFPL